MSADSGPRVIHREDIRKYAQAICQVNCGPPNTPPAMLEPCHQHWVEAWAIAGMRIEEGSEVLEPRDPEVVQEMRNLIRQLREKVNRTRYTPGDAGVLTKRLRGLVLDIERQTL